jgi:hypothetical protein
MRVVPGPIEGVGVRLNTDEPTRAQCHIPLPLYMSHHHFLTANQPPPDRHISSLTMADHSGYCRFRALFESALQSYEKKTGITLAEHPLAPQVQSFHTVESITAVLEAQVLAFGDLRGSDRVMTSIKSTLSILARLSSAASLGDAIGLVRRNILMACFTALMVFL